MNIMDRMSEAGNQLVIDLRRGTITGGGTGENVHVEIEWTHREKVFCRSSLRNEITNDRDLLLDEQIPLFAGSFQVPLRGRDSSAGKLDLANQICSLGVDNCDYYLVDQLVERIASFVSGIVNSEGSGTGISVVAAMTTTSETWFVDYIQQDGLERPSALAGGYKHLRKSAIHKVKKENCERGNPLQDCAICLEEFDEKKDATKLRCSHWFHYDCVAQWLEKKSNCPLCRRELKGLI